MGIRKTLFARLALALSIGAIGGFIFSWLRLPLAWMLGPMSFNMVASLGRLPVAIPNRLRAVTFAVIGLYLGSTFSPEVTEQLHRWPWSIIAVTVFVILLTIISQYYYRIIAGFDPITALFSATPGGLSLMVGLGTSVGGDERHIALTQTLRVVIVVFLIPPLAIGYAGLPALESSVTELNEFDQWQLLLLLTGGLIGIVIAHLIKLPASPMTGAMLASAMLYGGGWVQLQLPDLFLFISLWILGSSVGCRFAGTDIRELWSTGKHALLSVMIMLSLAALAAAGLSVLLEVDFLAALLALAPGGVTEMCLIAVALDIDPGFVAAHQLARILFIMSMGPLLSRLFLRFPRQ